MGEANKNEERRFDPELLKKGLQCDLDQYDMLKRCSEKHSMTEWNEWRFRGKNFDDNSTALGSPRAGEPKHAREAAGRFSKRERSVD